MQVLFLWRMLCRLLAGFEADELILSSIEKRIFILILSIFFGIVIELLCSV